MENVDKMTKKRTTHRRIVTKIVNRVDELLKTDPVDKRKLKNYQNELIEKRSDSKDLDKKILKLLTEHADVLISITSEISKCLINDGIEDTEHFLLQCHAYEDRRRDLLGTVNEVFQLHNISNLPNQTLVQTTLYGDKNFTHDQNRQILESTLKFIHSSERFL